MCVCILYLYILHDIPSLSRHLTHYTLLSYYTRLRTPTYPHYVYPYLTSHTSHPTQLCTHTHLTPHTLPHSKSDTHTSHFTQYMYKHTHSPYVTPYNNCELTSHKKKDLIPCLEMGHRKGVSENKSQGRLAQ